MTRTTNYNLNKPDYTDNVDVAKLNENADIIDAKLKEHSDALDLAAMGIRYCGEVDYYADLPSDAEIGDAYTVKYAGSSGTTLDGTEYVWGNVGGSEQWIDFSKDCYTRAEVNALLTSKQDTLNAAQLAAVNSGIDSTKVAQIATNTTTEAEDRAALVELVDGGAKNMLDLSGITPVTPSGITCTQDGDEWVVSGTITALGSVRFFNVPMTHIKNQVILSGCPSGGGQGIYSMDVLEVSGDSKDYGSGSGAFDIPDDSQFTLRFVLNAGTYSDLRFKPMICTKAAWDISHAYVPYRPSYDEVIARLEALENT